MPSYFPRHTITWKLEEPPAIRRFSLSLVEMAALTGVVLRAERAVVLTRAAAESWLYVGGMFAAGAIFLFAMLTVHLGNFPVRHWLWRAPGFALIEVAAESLTCLALIAVRWEPLGSARADFHDWLPLTWNVLLTHVIGILVYALILAGVVQLVRRLTLRREHRMHTVMAVHEHRGEGRS